MLHTPHVLRIILTNHWDDWDGHPALLGQARQGGTGTLGLSPPHHPFSSTQGTDSPAHRALLRVPHGQDPHSLQPSCILGLGLCLSLPHPQLKPCGGNASCRRTRWNHPCPIHFFGFLARHVLIAISLLYCFPLVIYFDVRNEMPSFKPKLGYWPSDSWPVVVPYIALEEPLKQC